MKKYILALDEGTTSTRSILFDKELNTVSMAQHEFTQIYPKAGWVEHDALEIYASQYATMTECIAKSGIQPSEIAAIGITNQRETTVVWDKKTGKPICNAIVWQCRRTADICEKLISDGYGEIISKKTGLKPDAYFSATKIMWILDNIEGARERAENGELLFGTIDSWLVFKLTDGRIHITDKTNASRTMLYNLESGDWDDELLKIFNIPRCMLPEIKSSGEIYGSVNMMGAEINIGGIAGDQQAALFGQGCFNLGEGKNTYGTGCFFLVNTGETPVFSKSGLITTAAATLKGENAQFALEGSVFVGGAVIQWLRDELRFIVEARDSEYFAKKVDSSGGVYVVPAFSGLGAPYWDMRARGSILGFTRGSGRNHIIRAALESIAYQTNDVLKAMQKDLGEKISFLKVDGGASANDFLMQFQADISDVEVLRPNSVESTALGAAFLAGLSSGFFKSRDELASKIKNSKTFAPSFSSQKREELIEGWDRAVKAVMNF